MSFGNVMFGLKLRPESQPSATGARSRYRFLELVGLEKFAHAHIHELSGGMKQRVALARALAPDPQVLLMDEPFGALDAMTREQLYDDIQQIWKKSRKTVVFVTHNVREAVCLGDRVLLMSPSPGRIVQAVRYPPPAPARHQQCRARDPCGADRRGAARQSRRGVPNEARAAPPRSSSWRCWRCGSSPRGAAAGRRCCSPRRCSVAEYLWRGAAGRNAARGDLGDDAAPAGRLRDRRRRSACRSGCSRARRSCWRTRSARSRSGCRPCRACAGCRSRCSGSGRPKARCCSSS